MAIALETGAIDISTSVSINDVRRFDSGGSSSAGFTVTKLRKNLTDTLLFNCDPGNIFANQTLRQAICYAIDNNAFLAGVLNNQGFVSKTFGNSKYSDYNPAWDNEDYYEYNLDKAKQLLAQAGYRPGQLSVKILTESATAHHGQEAQIMQAYLAELGINSQISSFESALYNTYRYDPSQFDLIIGQFASTDYLSNVWKLAFDNTSYERGTVNFVRDDKLQSLLMAACDPDGHTVENMNAFHYYLKDKAYGYCMVEGYDNIVHVSGIKKVVTDARGFVLPGPSEYATDFGK
jgi:ABC-type transport system substrate-binding protein